MGIYQGTIGEGIHMTIKIPLLVPLLLHKKEGRKITTSTRLLKAELPHRQKSISTTTNP